MATLHPLPLLLAGGLLAPVLIRAQANPGALSRIAFGSCLRQDKPQPIWNPILAAKPDLFLLIGDNVYADTEDMREMQADYDSLGASPGFRRLRAAVPVHATWDDHDYGANDAGAEFPPKEESKRIFLDFFREPADSPRRKRPGLQDARIHGPAGRRVQVILLDTRFFRGPLKKGPAPEKGQGPYVPNLDTGVTLLGAEQWQWLERQLRMPAEVRLVVSSIQVIAQEHGWEKWGNFPAERSRLFRLIRECGASGVIFLSGDRHLAELSLLEGEAGYPLFDLTSSSLNATLIKSAPRESNRYRVGSLTWDDNFGMVGIDWNRPDPEIRLEIRDAAGDVALRRKVPLSALRPRG